MKPGARARVPGSEFREITGTFCSGQSWLQPGLLEVLKQVGRPEACPTRG